MAGNQDEEVKQLHVDEYNDFPYLLARYQNALSRLEGMGVRVPVNSRLRSYERHLQEVIDDSRPAIEFDRIVQLAFDLREIDELIEIIDHVPAPVDKSTIDLLRRMPGGSENPDDEIGAEAREAQYELYLGSVVRRAGYVGRHGQPDLRILVDDTEYFVEAKRPSSLSRFDDRLRAAVHQIRRLPKGGIIAISLDQVLRPRGTLLEAVDFDFLAPAVARLVSDFVSSQTAVWRRRLRGESVDAIVLTARVPARIARTGHLSLGTNIHIEKLSTDDSREAPAIEVIVDAYLHAQGGRAA